MCLFVIPCRPRIVSPSWTGVNVILVSTRTLSVTSSTLLHLWKIYHPCLPSVIPYAAQCAIPSRHYQWLPRLYYTYGRSTIPVCLLWYLMLLSVPFLVDVSLNLNVNGMEMFHVLWLLAKSPCENGIKEVVHHQAPPIQEKLQRNHSVKPWDLPQPVTGIRSTVILWRPRREIPDSSTDLSATNVVTHPLLNLNYLLMVTWYVLHQRSYGYGLNISLGWRHHLMTTTLTQYTIN